MVKSRAQRAEPLGEGIIMFPTCDSPNTTKGSFFYPLGELIGG